MTKLKFRGGGWRPKWKVVTLSSVYIPLLSRKRERKNTNKGSEDTLNSMQYNVIYWAHCIVPPPPPLWAKYELDHMVKQTIHLTR